MRLTGVPVRISKYFATVYNPNLHSSIPTLDAILLHPLFQKHDHRWETIYTENEAFKQAHIGLGELEHTRLQLTRQLGKTELFYQQNLAKMFRMNHEYLPNGWITDLSNEQLLIEIKNAKNFRQAFGQISQYATFRPKAKKVICLFGILPPPSRMQANIEICENSNIDLVWVWSEQLYFWMTKDLVLQI